MSVPEQEILTVSPLPAMAAEVEALGRDNALTPSAERHLLEGEGVSLTARKACAALKITSALIKAIVVYPGGDSADSAIAQAAHDLMARASELTNAVIELANLDPSQKTHDGLISALCAQSAEIVSMNWRLAHATGNKEFSIPQIQGMLESALASAKLDGTAEDHTRALDLVTAQRVALLSVVPELHAAISGCFDYFVPDPESLVRTGVRCVLEMADYGIERLAADVQNTEARIALAQALVPKMGELYTSNYRAMARKDVHELRAMDSVKRHRRLHEHRLTGLPVGHIESSFQRLATRMIDMVVEAVPMMSRATVARSDLPHPISASADDGRTQDRAFA